jgi:FtsP/CotA-like multicopper oxidase with cupredoxin domain
MKTLLCLAAQFFFFAAFIIGTVPVRASDMSGSMSSGNTSSPTFEQRLNAQIDQEEAGTDLEGQRQKVETAMNRLMDEIAKSTDTKSGRNTAGGFGAMGMMQQMDRSFYLEPSGTDETVHSGDQCPTNVRKRQYDISAVTVEITQNQWGSYYPGYTYVLTENLDGVRKEEKRNAEARKNTKETDPIPVSTGLQTDLIQPLVLRANQGDCLIITLQNQMKDEDVSLHIHGSSMIVKSTGQPATSANPDSIVKPGKSQTFEWYISPNEQEGSHMFHSHVGRDQTSLGMSGAVIVEPIGSIYLDPISGKEMRSGWQAMIVRPDAPDFREFVIVYHEVGDKSFRTLNRRGEMNAQRDPFTDSYRPGNFALNFRSEPFGVNNLAMQEKYFHFVDESLSYSAYTFGDAPTPIPRSYLGDPAKFRIIHGGGEAMHSHHPHGGAIRWLRQPKADTKATELFTAAANGPVKFPVVRTTSDRVDAQMIGPSEALDLETECGSGLCQALAGDFLFHCHVAQHYVAGMWSYWRVYNTLQDGNYPFRSTDIMPPLQELPDRIGRMKPAVTSDKLINRTMDWYDKKWNITEKVTDRSKPIPEISIKDWVKMMLPPPGQPGHTADEKGQIVAYDATVWDWTWEGNKALGEPEVTGAFPWPKYTSPMPGKRPPLMFEEKTGKLAWPHMKPHLGKRMPFAPNHGPAPWLEPVHLDKNTGAIPTDPGGVGAPGEQTTLPARPGEQGRWSLCPQNAGRKQYTIHFIETPITLSKALGTLPPVVDEHGLIYVLHEEEAAVRSNEDLRRPLVYRANVYDCVDILLKSEWNDDDIVNLQASKINIHPHFIQFDNQASDGVMTGFSYEQSVRPFTMLEKKEHKGLPTPMNAVLTDDVRAGASSIEIKMTDGATPFHIGTELMIGMHEVKTSEIRRIKNIQANVVTFTEPLRFGHKKNEIASVEFVRYRYWVDSDIGTVYWHDHTRGAFSWQHGAVGAMIVEPVGSTYHDPKTGKEIRSGPIADIHSTEPIGYGVNGSFRELAVMLQDTVPSTAQVNPYPGQTIQTAIDFSQALSFRLPYDLDKVAVMISWGVPHTSGGGLSFRAESIARRLKFKPEPSMVFSSRVYQDPNTPLLRAYLGDTIVFRILNALMNETHTWHLAGHAFRTERYAVHSDLRNAYHVGIAERYDLVTKAGGPQQMAGDYLHYNGRTSKLSEGSWGIIRVLDKEVPDLQKLPGRDEIPASAKNVCPADAPVKSFNVIAADRALKYNTNAPDTIDVDFDRKLQVANPTGKIYMLEGEKSKVAEGGAQPMPLTLHVNVGDCIKVNLKNEMKASRASFSADMLAFDPKDSQGMNVGNNRVDQTIGPGQSRTYTFYAPPQYGETAALVWDWGSFINNVRDGLFGAIIVGPKGSKYRDPKTGEDVTLKSAWEADVIVDRKIPENANRSDFRDAALFFQDEDNSNQNAFMPYLQQIAGLTGVNYRSEPWSYRENKGCEPGNMFTACVTGESGPVTPTILAHAGDQIRIHVFGAFNEQNQIFSLEGHEWPLKPSMIGADLLSSGQFGSSENLDIITIAGGRYHIPGTYLWQNHRLQYTQAGQWGYLKVLAPGDRRILLINQENLGSAKFANFSKQSDGNRYPVDR